MSNLTCLPACASFPPQLPVKAQQHSAAQNTRTKKRLALQISILQRKKLKNVTACDSFGFSQNKPFSHIVERNVD